MPKTPLAKPDPEFLPENVRVLHEGRNPPAFVKPILREVGTERLLWVDRPNFIGAIVIAGGLGILSLVVGFVCLLNHRQESRFAGGVGVVLALWAFERAFRIGWRSARTVYCVTDARIVILEVGRTVAVVSWSPRMISGLQATVRAGGRGNLLFAKDDSGNTIGFRRDGFYGIDNVIEVERLIREVLLSKPPHAD